MPLICVLSCNNKFEIITFEWNNKIQVKMSKNITDYDMFNYIINEVQQKEKGPKEFEGFRMS